jgi:hypothetical protein
LEVSSNGLTDLHNMLRTAAPNTFSFSEYRPHITLAYVEPGTGKKYTGLNSLKGELLTFDEIVFSNREHERSYISLAGGGVRFSSVTRGKASQSITRLRNAAEMAEKAMRACSNGDASAAEAHLLQAKTMGAPAWAVSRVEHQIAKLTGKPKKSRRPKTVAKLIEAVKTGDGPDRITRLMELARSSHVTEKELSKIGRHARSARYGKSKRRFRNGDVVIFKPGLQMQSVAGRIVSMIPVGDSQHRARIAYLDPNDRDEGTGLASTKHGVFTLMGNSVIPIVNT